MTEFKISHDDDIIKSEDGDTTIQGMYYPNKGGRRRKTRRLFRRRLTKKLAKRSK